MSKYVTDFLSLVIVISTITCFHACSFRDPKTPKPAPKEKQIEKINFFMETSGSMTGYLHGATDFSKRIPNLLVSIEGRVDSGKLRLHNYYIADSIVPFNGSTQDFINALAVKPPPGNKSSEMHKIFEMIAQHTGTNDISLFVSDCILSYPDKVVKANPEINKYNAEGELKATLTSAFQELHRKKKMCATVYGFNSTFIGNYYTYQNKVIPLAGNVSRPYYLWVIGNRELLTRFNKQISTLESLQPYTLAMDFGVFGKAVTESDILFDYGKKGSWSVDSEMHGLKNVKPSAKEPVVFAVVTDLSSLPPYARDTSYLRSHLKTAPTDLKCHIDKILLAENVAGSKLKSGEIDKVKAGTHIFVLRMDDLHQSGQTGLILPLQYDTSYRALSIMDDRKVTDIPGKTFALEHLIDGVRLAYDNSSQHYIDISIPIKK
ncbi:hypothetical protein [Chitinophaga rhizophila]|uniref:Lipoprotein n=1 Tax=Chitinophaga rhizophila TaxID=2866212 RepID=A0ABS7GHD1_9BACT|nr:hypothetical protein [Chitinophaga rhizophila]MBW8687113.1 hypothetical protein [Chitinophaga rhizophila]